jgi:hypothetical protein
MVEHWAIWHWKTHGTIPPEHADKIAGYRSEDDDSDESVRTVATNTTSVEAKIEG